MTDDIFEFDNIIPIDYQNYIEQLMLGFNFPWYYNKNLVSPDSPLLDRIDNHQGFQHILFDEGKSSTHFELLYPLVLSITSKNISKNNNLCRMRANLTLQNRDTHIEHHLPHIDAWHQHWVAIYYVNDSDGDTFIFNEKNENYDRGPQEIAKIQTNEFTVKKRIIPKKGKVVVFNGQHYHASSWPTVSKSRAVININLDKIELYL